MKTIPSKNNIRQLTSDLPFYLLAALILFGIKYFYSGAGSDELKWILAPTTRWVELLSGIPFLYEQGTGYVNHDLRLLIAPSCSGVQFMLITFATLIFSFLHRIGNTVSSKPLHRSHPIWKKLLWFALSLVLSYILTILINGLRIIVAIYLPIYFEGNHFLRKLLSPDRLHTTIGIIVYFVSLLTIYQLAEYAFQKRNGKCRDDTSLLQSFLRKCLSPVFWYFFIVLGIPFLNNAYRKSGAQFTNFALLVTGCCGIVLLLYALTALIWRSSRHKPDSPEHRNDSP